jgi:hypothetical protein
VQRGFNRRGRGMKRYEGEEDQNMLLYRYRDSMKKLTKLLFLKGREDRGVKRIERVNLLKTHCMHIWNFHMNPLYY